MACFQVCPIEHFSLNGGQYKVTNAEKHAGSATQRPASSMPSTRCAAPHDNPPEPRVSPQTMEVRLRADATGRQPLVVPSGREMEAGKQSAGLLVRTKAPQHPRLAALKASMHGRMGTRPERPGASAGHGWLRANSDREMPGGRPSHPRQPASSGCFRSRALRESVQAGPSAGTRACA